MKIDIITPIPKERYSEVLEVVLSSFRERKEAGLNFAACSFTLKDIEKIAASHYSWAAVSENGAIIGVVFRRINKSGKELIGYNYLMATQPEYKGLGVATAISSCADSFFKEKGCRYMLSDTSVKAFSSVKYHLKNGYLIVGLLSWPNTNYYSYLFRKDYETISWVRKNILYRLKYAKSYIKCKMYYNSDGSFTFYRILINKLRVILEKYKR